MPCAMISLFCCLYFNVLRLNEFQFFVIPLKELKREEVITAMYHGCLVNNERNAIVFAGIFNIKTHTQQSIFFRKDVVLLFVYLSATACKELKVDLQLLRCIPIHFQLLVNWRKRKYYQEYQANFHNQLPTLNTRFTDVCLQKKVN